MENFENTAIENTEVEKPDNAEQSGVFPDDKIPDEVKPFKLNWQQAEIQLYKGKFRHFFRRPEPEEVLEWQDKLSVEIQIAKDGSIPLVTDSAQDEKANAEFYELIRSREADGYHGRPVPQSHKSAAVKKLYERTIWIDEDADIFAEEIVVNEVMGDVNNPVAHLKHAIANPMFDDAKLRRIKNTINGGVMQTDRKGGRKIVGNKPVRKTYVFYLENCVRLTGSEENEKSLVDPLIAHSLTAKLVSELTDALSD